jgi:hypothetical protein
MHDPEFDQFKRDIHLVDYAVRRYGYTRDPRESSRRSHVLRQPSTNDKIIVRQGEGHWTYFSVRDDHDNGTIIDFVQRRQSRSLGEVRQELRGWLGIPRPAFEPASAGEPPRPAPSPSPSPAARFEAARALENSPYLNARGIRPETLAAPRFRESWRVDDRGNTLFVHKDGAGEVTGFEVRNRSFIGFAAGGTKSAWQSASRPDDRAVVITESAVDALSYHQLHGQHAVHTRYLSTAGFPSSRQVALFDELMAKLPRGSLVVAAVDADEAGQKLSRQLETLTTNHSHLRFRHHAPALGKDWNEVLQRTERDYIRSLPLAIRALHPQRERGR